MKRCGYGNEPFANHVKKEPKQDEAKRALQRAKYAFECGTVFNGTSYDFLQASGANNSVVVFCDTFPAEKASAFGATSSRLAFSVIVATL